MNHIPKGVEEDAQEEEAAQPGRVRKQDQPKTFKQRMNPTKLSPKKASSERVALRYAVTYWVE